ncbi:hypothetical protein KIH75_03705 [Bifidobacterium sp. 64T4]|uniref:hypothetical protein n=1 Tax=Bifidobacterium pongonis TaxID=2834432 RepID=UPI001C575267|nr:hypothetical protein [Bifidobacterium pongonis]MBW3094464.1 hypothetical protein [Bifidobacterium pongonis]
MDDGSLRSVPLVKEIQRHGLRPIHEMHPLPFMVSGVRSGMPHLLRERPCRKAIDNDSPVDQLFGRNNLAYDNVLTENNRVNASKRNAKILRYLAIARFFVVMGFFGITGLCLQNNCVGFDAYNGSNVNHRYDVYVTLIGWFLYEITSSFYLLGDGSATRQGPGALASPIAQRFASPFYDSMEWVLQGRRHATVAAMCVYAAAGVANLAIVTIWLYLGIYPSHPVTGSVGESGVALHILMPAAGMYAMNIMTLFVESHVGFMVEEPQLNVPEGGWRASSTPPMLR